MSRFDSGKIGKTFRPGCTLAILLAAVASCQRGWCGEAMAANAWVKVDEGKTGVRGGSALLWATDLKRMLLVGPAEGAPFVQAFDPASPAWGQWTSAAPAVKKDFSPYYQAAYDPAGRTVYCLSGGPILYSLSGNEKAWKTHPAAAELEGLSWHTMACDPTGRKLVVVGADKKAENLGWSRTVVYDIPTGKWSRLEVASERVVHVHRQRVAAKEACIDLTGHIRLAWYRDPKGVASSQEVAALLPPLRGFRTLAADERIFGRGEGRDRPGPPGENAGCPEGRAGLAAADRGSCRGAVSRPLRGATRRWPSTPRTVSSCSSAETMRTT